ncbi:LGFP repeat-containing protein [Hymenobacter psoromatis]|uniref:LGFP repeat-containing protein n=1 Tax=Hymenobacter psoromatis TaxID=1484116 RepID=UPI001CBB3A00|nr:hypothetical protein [Hymenobacter psoromatis]
MTLIQDKVQALAQSGFDVGAPVTAETPERDGGALQQFAAATIIAHPALGTFEVHGLIRDRYEQDGGIQGNALGYPLSDEEADPDVPGGRRSRFQFGQLTWSGAVGVTLVSAGGSPTPAPDPTPTPDPVPAAAAPPAPLHQLTDVTARVLRELNLVPGGSRRPGPAQRAGDAAPFLQAKMGELPADADKSTWQSLLLACEANNLTLLDTWDPQPLAAIACLSAQDTDDPQVFKLADGAFDFDGSADVQHVVLERPGNVFPKLIAVSFPKSLLESEETPFLVYFHPTLGQAVPSGYYTAAPNLKSPEDGNFYPYGWDFLFHGFWKYLNYSGPDFTTEYSIGLDYQMAQSGKAVAVVLPIFHANDGINVGDFLKPDQILLLLAEIKWFFTQKAELADGKPTAANFRVAMGAFSSATSLLATVLGNINSVFCRDVLREVYFFDAPQGVGHACVAAALAWAKDNADKHVRFYSQWTYDNYNQVLGGQKTVQSARLVVHPANPNRSVALVPQAFWEPIVNDVALKDIKARGWAAIHALVPSTLLADALARSGF